MPLLIPIATEMVSRGRLFFFIFLSLHTACSSETSLRNSDHTHLEQDDTFPPLTNPTTTPITIPSTIPTPGMVTILPTNPAAATPITIPATNPMPTTPITNPTTNPVFIPPVIPITNPIFSPPTNPLINPPLTNPVTTYPVSPPAMLPSITPPTTMPGTVPVSPVVSGQSWCVAKTGTMDAALQVALDYACGAGGADCSAIQTTGSCYNPSSLQAHASYAFNSYYQKNPVPTSCDFGGTAMLVGVNPSSGTCIFPSSSSASSYSTPASSSGAGVGSTNPGAGVGSTNPGAGVGFGSTSPITGFGPTVLNGSSTVFGSDNPTGALSNGFSLSAWWWFLALVFTTICITGNSA